MHSGEEENERRGSLTKTLASAHALKQQQQCEVPWDKDLSLWLIKSNVRLTWTNLFRPIAIYVLQSKAISCGCLNIIWSSTWISFLQLQILDGRDGMAGLITSPSKSAEMNECECKTCTQAFQLTDSSSKGYAWGWIQHDDSHKFCNESQTEMRATVIPNEILKENHHGVQMLHASK